MSKPTMNPRTEPGQLINLNTMPREHTQASRSRPRRSGAVLTPHWKNAAQAISEPMGIHPSTDGALALVRDPEETPTPQPVAARGHILLVEDDQRMRCMLHEALALEGESDWDVQVASEGAHALNLAGATPPDVVLLDVRLPDLGGAEIYQWLRANQKTRTCRVLFLTADTSLDLQRRGIEDGVLLRKPFEVRELVSLVRALIEG
jgi:CheY-like chemotaxis protein